MPTCELDITVRESANNAQFARVVAEGEDVLATEIGLKESVAARWDEIIDHKLIEWGSWRRSTMLQQDFEADGLIGPTSQAICKACQLVNRMRMDGWDLPTGIIPDGEGGIAFENRHGSLYQRIEIQANGEMFLVTFRDAKLLDRSQIDVE